MVIRVIIIDDEQPALDMLTFMLNKYFSHKFIILDKCSNIEDAEKSIKEYVPDLVFLDIRMKNGGGFTLLKKLGKVNFDVIFTTAYSEYGVEAIKQSALDYLLKPIKPAELIFAVKKFEDKHVKKYEVDRIQLLIDNLEFGRAEFPNVAFPIYGGYKLVKPMLIKYCVSDINYTKVHFIDGTFLVVAKTLKKIEEILPKKLFLRTHKSYLVNKNYVKKYLNKEGHFLILSDDEQIPVSVRRKGEILQSIT
ncbi:MAG: LytR/AlgR family response regulator transcription factor [Lishizhenia sp.]